MNIIMKLKIKLASPRKRAELLKQTGYDIGEHCEIYPNVSFGTEPYLIHIGNDVRIISETKLITHDGTLWVLRNKRNNSKLDCFGEIYIGNNVAIGIGSLVMPGVHIGDNVIIGAHSVVTKDIPGGCVAVGSPARVIETLDEYEEKMNDKIVETKGMNDNNKKQFLIDFFARKHVDQQ